MHKIFSTLAARNPLPLILLVAVIVRVAFSLIYYFSPEWDQLLVDALFHDRWATEISKGHILGEEPFFRAPFYIYILGGIYWAVGHSLTAARIFGHLIGLISIAVTYFIAARLFSKREAVIAALIHALYPIALYFESELLVESLFTMLVELSILMLFLSIERRRSLLFILTGIIVGLAAITRPVILPLFPLYLIWIFRAMHGRRTKLLSGLICAIGVILPIMPVTARNLLIGKDTVIIASSGGINFYIGNNQSADGLSASVPIFGSNWQIQDIKYIAEKEAGHAMKASELSDFWYGKGIDWILNNKLEFAKLYLKRLYYCFNNFEVSNNRDIGLFFKSNPILYYNPLNFAFILSLAIMALIILTAQRRLRGEIAFIVIFVAAYLMLISLFFINARFRLPAVPLIIIISSFGLTGMVSLFWSRLRILRIGVGLIAGLATYAFSSSNLYRIQEDNMNNGLFNQANYFFSNGNYDKAISLYHQVMRADPTYPKTNLNLGAVFLKTGSLDSAEFYLKEEISLFPQSALGYSNLSSLFYLKGEPQKALKYAGQAIALKPYLADGYLIKMRVLAALNDTLATAKCINKAQEALGKHPKIMLDAGLIYSNWHRYEDAKAYLMEALQSQPKAIETNDDAFSHADYVHEISEVKAKSAYQLGYIYGVTNRLQESIEMSSRAIALDSSIVEAYINLVNGYMLKGESQKARAILDIALRHFPQDKFLNILKEKKI